MTHGFARTSRTRSRNSTGANTSRTKRWLVPFPVLFRNQPKYGCELNEGIFPSRHERVTSRNCRHFRDPSVGLVSIQHYFVVVEAHRIPSYRLRHAGTYGGRSSEAGMRTGRSTCVVLPRIVHDSAVRIAACSGKMEVAMVEIQPIRVEIEREDDGRILASVPDLPGVMAYGSTEDEAIRKGKSIALQVLADMIESGEDGT